MQLLVDRTHLVHVVAKMLKFGEKILLYIKMRLFLQVTSSIDSRLSCPGEGWGSYLMSLRCRYVTFSPLMTLVIHCAQSWKLPLTANEYGVAPSWSHDAT